MEKEKSFTKDGFELNSGSVSGIEVYSSDEFGNIRIVTINGEPWFCLKDLCCSLGLTAKEVNRRLSDDVVSKHPIIDSLGRTQEALFVNEDGMYDVILESRKEEAKRFRKWVTSDVLPTIRKHGIYATDNVIDEIMNNPDFGIKLLTKLKEEREARIKAERKNAILTHVNKTYTMTEIAKELNLKSAIKLNQMLAEKKIQYKVNGTWVFYSKYSNLGYEEIKQEVLDNGRVVYHRKITQLGREFILELFDSVA